ncbi:rRNA processing-related protein [Pseudozyma hubeiensis SY62]|uniref:rRNA processing-related protein n=1 Tax=Pseudozyma hubeiensis (strain SY62) TaxID=1305764 RepID=R9P8X7_PSEHS|nr:rRNA processing-related protein [Pseudozyma hubeiensis SY62]GAC97717.1 rRNA processing-related protein [Pseudozyma hubeiensis SY62]
MAAASTSKAASGSKRKATPSASTATKTKKTKSSTVSTNAAEDASIPLGRALASTEKRTRDSAIRSLHTYLSTNGAHTIPPLELQKLWKGLFYCFWMSDKPLIQQRLANDLSQLVLVHPADEEADRLVAGMKFLEGFWDVMVGEWSGLDKHRIDKFYLLVRRFVAAGFRLLAEEGWKAEGVKELSRILGKFEGGVLSTNDPKVPDSLTYHLSDIYLDELEKVLEQHAEEAEGEDGEDGGEEEQDLPLVPTLELLTPFVDALATAKSKAMYERIWSNVFEPLLEDTLRASAKDEDISLDAIDSDDEEQDEQTPEDAESEDEQAADETANGTEFHSFADESTLTTANDDESEPSIPDSSDDEPEDDVRFPLLLALSAVPIPKTKEDVEEEDLDEADIDVALVLRKAIFQALFTAASRKDATEARRRLLYQLWRDEQDRINDVEDEDDNEDDEDENDEDDEDEEEDEEE